VTGSAAFRAEIENIGHSFMKDAADPKPCGVLAALIETLYFGVSRCRVASDASRQHGATNAHVSEGSDGG
jgi:hypothetical protein